MVEFDAPQFVYVFLDADGDEVGDRVFALDRLRADALEEQFGRLAHKKAVAWRRFRITPDGPQAHIPRAIAGR